MLQSIEGQFVWEEYVSSRLSHAVAEGFIRAGAKIIDRTAFLVLPDGVREVDLSKFSPEAPMREVLGTNTNTYSGWLPRPDAFSEAARETLRYSTVSGDYFYFEAGYGRKGDKYLESFKDIIFDDLTIVCINTRTISSDILAERMRKGRSWRFMGVITYEHCNVIPLSSLSGHFVCDAFDGDTVLFVKWNIGSY